MILRPRPVLRTTSLVQFIPFLLFDVNYLFFSQHCSNIPTANSHSSTRILLNDDLRGFVPFPARHDTHLDLRSRYCQDHLFFSVTLLHGFSWDIYWSWFPCLSSDTVPSKAFNRGHCPNREDHLPSIAEQEP